MDRQEAERIIKRFVSEAALSEEDEVLFLDALNYMVREEKDCRAMVELGGYYYEMRHFDLALKYYEMADEAGDDWAPEGLGYIWYYGRTGECDDEKAFRYFSRAAVNGHLKSKLKVADMYRDGRFVEKNPAKYREILEEMYLEVKDARLLGEPLPEVFTRLARVRRDDGEMSAAVNLLLEAKDFLAQRIHYTLFFGDLTIMKFLVWDLYAMIAFNPEEMDIYDLYWLYWNQPACVSFLDEFGEEHFLRAGEWNEERSGYAVKFGGRWYRNIDEFFEKATLGGRRIAGLGQELYGFRIEEAI